MAALYPMGYNADFSQRTYDLRHAQENSRNDLEGIKALHAD
jgi:hypothetical protein